MPGRLRQFARAEAAIVRQYPRDVGAFFRRVASGGLRAVAQPGAIRNAPLPRLLGSTGRNLGNLTRGVAADVRSMGRRR